MKFMIKTLKTIIRESYKNLDLYKYDAEFWGDIAKREYKAMLRCCAITNYNMIVEFMSADSISYDDVTRLDRYNERIRQIYYHNV